MIKRSKEKYVFNKKTVKASFEQALRQDDYKAFARTLKNLAKE